jgi:hypothetical protein
VSEDDSVFTDFINTQEDGESSVPLADTDDPVNWGQLGASIGGGIVASFFVGINAVIRAYETLIIAPLEGTVEFLAGQSLSAGSGGNLVSDGFIGLLFSPFTRIANQAWAIDLEPFGLFALPVGVLLVVAVLWIVARTSAWILDKGVI